MTKHDVPLILHRPQFSSSLYTSGLRLVSLLSQGLLHILNAYVNQTVMSLTTEFPSISTKANPGQAPGGLGKGLFASISLKSGEDVLSTQTPFVAVLETPRLDDTCSGCFGKRQLENADAELKACTGCQVVKYCDRVSRMHSCNRSCPTNFFRYANPKTGKPLTRWSVPSIRS